ncbi:dscam12 [Trichonephila inaurata madagascariensis]|uniref:Dscam12 n=1 Tax=Trichonephila inaurata madagascariensis TaxID=2747483 RepID=A0A8X7CRM4_9ARAC|nr:dscam12 [Trichonephila inaurata madagascariensis]
MFYLCFWLYLSFDNDLTTSFYQIIVVSQHYVVEVYDEFVPPGSTAVLRCHIPGFMEEYVSVMAWREEPTGKIIQPTASLGSRYLTFPWGTLHIRNVETSFSHRSYKCQTRNRLTGEVVESTTAGRLIVSGNILHLK